MSVRIESARSAAAWAKRLLEENPSLSFRDAADTVGMSLEQLRHFVKASEIPGRLPGKACDAIPAAPLLALVRRRAEQTGVRVQAFLSSDTEDRWAETGAVVSGVTADRWLGRLNLNWWDVWPGDEAACTYFEGPEGS